MADRIFGFRADDDLILRLKQAAAFKGWSASLLIRLALYEVLEDIEWEMVQNESRAVQKAD